LASDCHPYIKGGNATLARKQKSNIVFLAFKFAQFPEVGFLTQDWTPFFSSPACHFISKRKLGILVVLTNS
jgi:hypothetical protein